MTSHLDEEAIPETCTDDRSLKISWVSSSTGLLLLVRQLTYSLLLRVWKNPIRLSGEGHYTRNTIPVKAVMREMKKIPRFSFCVMETAHRIAADVRRRIPAVEVLLR